MLDNFDDSAYYNRHDDQSDEEQQQHAHQARKSSCWMTSIRFDEGAVVMEYWNRDLCAEQIVLAVLLILVGPASDFGDGGKSAEIRHIFSRLVRP